MVGEIARVDGDRLVVLALFVLFAPAARVETIEEDLLPVDLVARFFVGGGFGFGRLLLVLFLLLEVNHLEERVVQKLLLEVLLEVEQGHVQQVHRLVQARIDFQLLLELSALLETGFHWTTMPSWPSAPSVAAKRARRRAASVGPR